MPELCTLVSLMDRQQLGDGGPSPPPCPIGALDFEIDCQLIQQTVIGYG